MSVDDSINRLTTWFRQQFLQRTGIWIREKDVPSLKQTLVARTHACRLINPDAYQSFLTAEKTESAQEWKLLTETLKNGESFFFRDQAQMSLLRNTILPELIARNSERRSLRVWSAGCSTGEEPYSLAMLLYELLPNPSTWNLTILGTDLSDASVHKARSGRYGSWSFRMVDPVLQQRYFQQEGSGFLIDPKIRRTVTFRQGNLLKDEFPRAASSIHDMDLILCRNVFIYFEPQGIATVLGKFARTLTPTGYLMTGHAELHQVDVTALRTVRYPESLMYQRSDIATVATPTIPIPATAPKAPVASTPVIRPRSTPPLPARPPRATTVVSQPEPKEEREDMLACARTHANAGRHDLAAEYCRRAIRVDPVAYESYYLLSHIKEECGDWEMAKELLNKVIFLAPRFAPAYLDLSTIYESEGRSERAQKLRQTAQELLDGEESERK